MISLKKQTGLPLHLDETSGMLFSDEPEKIHYDFASRSLQDAAPYYQNPKGQPETKELYFMYRGIHAVQDDELCNSCSLRHDITVLLAGKIKDEFYKTIGHIHPYMVQQSIKNNLRYPEVYYVISGQAQYVLQKFSKDGTSIEDISIVQVNPGEAICIPSHYGHVTVNVSNTPLVMANIIEKSFASDYTPYKQKNGAAVYLMADRKSPYVLVENPSYSSLPTPKVLSYTSFQAPNVSNHKALYTQFMQDPEKYSYLYKE